MQQTEHFNLNQYELTDRILMENFNSDNAKIDAALKAQADTIATKANISVLEQYGNCRAVSTTYEGTGAVGSGNAITLNFEKPPLAVFIFNSEIGITAPKTNMKVLRVSSVCTPYTTWAADQKSVTWYDAEEAVKMLNRSGATYHVLILYAA